MATAMIPTTNNLMKYTDTIIISTERAEKQVANLVDHINEQKQNGRQLVAKLPSEPGQPKLDLNDVINHTVSVLVFLTDDFAHDPEAKIKYFGALQDAINNEPGNLTVVPVYVPNKEHFPNLRKLPYIIQATKHINMDFNNLEPFFDELWKMLESENALIRRRNILSKLHGDHDTSSEMQDLNAEFERARVREDGCQYSEGISKPVECTEDP